MAVANRSNMLPFPSPEHRRSVRRLCAPEERIVPWRLLLPVSEDAPVFATGLRGSDLGRLGTAFREVHYSGMIGRDAARLASSFRGTERRGSLFRVDCPSAGAGYAGIVVRPETGFPGHGDPRLAYRWLVPGGTAVWIGRREQLPPVSELAASGFVDIRRFLMPSSEEDILVPVDVSRPVRRALRPYVATGWTERLFLHTERLAALLRLPGCKLLVAGRRPGFFRQGGYFLDRIQDELDVPTETCSIHAGPAGPACRFYDARGRDAAYVKVAAAGRGSEGMEREDVILDVLDRDARLRAFLPPVRKGWEWRGHAFRLQAPESPGDRAPQEEGGIAFLESLRATECREMFLEEWPTWSVLWRWAHEAEFPFYREGEAIRVGLERCAETLIHRRIPFHRVHGDFTNWHILAGAEGPVVADWERSVPLGLPLFDAARYALSRNAGRNRPDAGVSRLNDLPVPAVDGNNELGALADELRVPADVARLAILHAYIVSRFPAFRPN